MNHFKKRTLALILASTMTVVGAFGAENYKNSLMSLEFESDSNGAVNVKLYTKLKYDKNIIPKKLDPTTYVIMLPEMDSQGMSEAKLSNNVEKYDIKTMPYTTGNKGYTNITIKTLPNVPLSATNSLYIASSETEENKVSENTVSENAQSSQESYKYTENNSKSDTVNKQVSKTETTINDS